MIELVDVCELSFDNRFVRDLPADPLRHNVPRQVPGACYTLVDPTPVGSPTLLAWSDSVGRMLGASPPQSVTGPVAEVLGGNRVLPGMQPYAARYGGHQFGHWAGQLGDGRAITLCEVVGAGRSASRPAAQGGGTNPVFAHGRRARGAALLGPRVHVQRGHVSPRRADDAGAEPRVHRGVGGARHVLRRPSQGRAGRHRLSRRAVVRALRQLRDPRRPPGAGCARAAGRPRDRHALPGARCAVPRRRTPAGSRRSAGAPP